MVVLANEIGSIKNILLNNLQELQRKKTLN